MPDYNCSCSKLHLTLLLLFAKVVFVEAGVAAGHSFFGYLFGQKGGLGREYGTMRFQPECWLSTRMLIVNAIVDGQYALVIWSDMMSFQCVLHHAICYICCHKNVSSPNQTFKWMKWEFQRPFSLLGLYLRNSWEYHLFESKCPSFLGSGALLLVGAKVHKCLKRFTRPGRAIAPASREGCWVSWSSLDFYMITGWERTVSTETVI